MQTYPNDSKEGIDHRTKRTSSASEGASIWQRVRAALTTGSSPGRPAETADDLDLDETLHAISNERRRRVLRRVAAAKAPSVDINDIAREIAGVENDCAGAETTHKERRRVYISLYQTHLPKLDRDGLLAWDADQGLIQATPGTHGAVQALEAIEGVVGGENR